MSEYSLIIERRNMARILSSDKRNIFLQSALALFVKNGVSQTTTKSISKAAGTAAGTLFLYFPTKQDLINTLTLEITEELTIEIKKNLSPNLSARESFWGIWDATTQFFIKNPNAYLYIRQIRDSGILDEKIIQETNRVFLFYYETIQKGLQEKSIRPYPIEIVGNLLYHSMVSIIDIINANPDLNKKRTIELGFEMYWNSIKSD